MVYRNMHMAVHVEDLGKRKWDTPPLMDEEGDVVMLDVSDEDDVNHLSRRLKTADLLPFEIDCIKKRRAKRRKNMMEQVEDLFHGKCSLRDPNTDNNTSVVEKEEIPVHVVLQCEEKKETVNVYDLIEETQKRKRDLEERIAKRQQERKERADRQEQDRTERERIRQSIASRLDQIAREEETYRIINLLVKGSTATRWTSSAALRQMIVKGLRQYHPDRQRHKPVQEQVESEELYKILVDLKDRVE